MCRFNIKCQELGVKIHLVHVLVSQIQYVGIYIAVERRKKLRAPCLHLLHEKPGNCITRSENMKG